MFEETMRAVVKANPFIKGDDAIRRVDALIEEARRLLATHEGRVEWLRRHVPLEEVQNRPINAIKTLRNNIYNLGMWNEATLLDCRDAVNEYRGV